MGGDIPGTYAPFPYPVLIVAIEGSAGYVILGVGDEDVFRIGMDHDPVWDTNVFLATVQCSEGYINNLLERTG